MWTSYLWTLPNNRDGFRFPRSEHRLSPATTRVLSREASSSNDQTASTTDLDHPPRVTDDHTGDAGDTGDPYDATELDDVYRWAAHSPYSPLHLQHLRQPVPRDGPRYYRFSFSFPPWSSSPSSNSSSPDSSLFTFRDAFEDLLLVSSGYSPADLNGVFAAKVFEDELAELFGYSGQTTREGQHVATWTAKLGQLGLWHSYFPRLAVSSGMHSFSNPYDQDVTLPSAGDWLAARRRWLDRLQDSPALGSVCQRFRFRPSTRIMSGEWEKVWDWGQRSRGLAEWSSQVSNEVDKSSRAPEPNADTETSSSSEHGPEEAEEVEEDLYSFIAASDFPHRGDQQQGEATATVEKTSSQEPVISETTETTSTFDGGKIVKTVRRHDNKAKGSTEIITKTERYDAEGNLISHSNSTSTTWSSSWYSSAGSSNGAPETSLSRTWSEDQERKSKTGWFWTR